MLKFTVTYYLEIKLNSVIIIRLDNYLATQSCIHTSCKMQNEASILSKQNFSKMLFELQLQS